jgi:hypothetical protein
MSNVKVPCNCVAIYEMIETKGPSGDPSPIKCVLCEKELIAWEGAKFDSSALVGVPSRIGSNAGAFRLLDMVLCLPAPLLNL